MSKATTTKKNQRRKPITREERKQRFITEGIAKGGDLLGVCAGAELAADRVPPRFIRNLLGGSSHGRRRSRTT